MSLFVSSLPVIDFGNYLICSLPEAEGLVVYISSYILRTYDNKNAAVAEGEKYPDIRKIR